MIEQRLLTPGEVAALFRVDPKTVTRWAAAGRLSSIRTPGGHRRFPESEVRTLLEGSAEPAVNPGGLFTPEVVAATPDRIDAAIAATRTEVDCPRARSSMTPCIARDGHLALSDPPQATSLRESRSSVCVGCGHAPSELLADLAKRWVPAAERSAGWRPPDAQADLLTELVAEYVSRPAERDPEPRSDEPVGEAQGR